MEGSSSPVTERCCFHVPHVACWIKHHLCGVGTWRRLPESVIERASFSSVCKFVSTEWKRKASSQRTHKGRGDDLGVLLAGPQHCWLRMAEGPGRAAQGRGSGRGVGSRFQSLQVWMRPSAGLLGGGVLDSPSLSWLPALGLFVGASPRPSSPCVDTGLVRLDPP